MSDAEKVLEHLKMIQGVINRLASNSFLIKGWSLTLIVAAMVLIARKDMETPYLTLPLIIPVLIFWFLDGYFLWQERLFRKLYEEIRGDSDTDYNMGVGRFRTELRWLKTTFSRTLILFYLMELAIVAFLYFVVSANNSPTS